MILYLNIYFIYFIIQQEPKKEIIYRFPASPCPHQNPVLFTPGKALILIMSVVRARTVRSHLLCLQRKHSPPSPSLLPTCSGGIRGKEQGERERCHVATCVHKQGHFLLPLLLPLPPFPWRHPSEKGWYYVRPRRSEKECFADLRKISDENMTILLIHRKLSNVTR